MKEGYFPLVFGLVMVSFLLIFWYIDASRNQQAELLASDVKAFLENLRTESSDHLNAYQQARELSLLIRSPNRMFLSMASLVLAVQFLSVFFQNSKGRTIVQKISKAWTWRP